MFGIGIGNDVGMLSYFGLNGYTNSVTNTVLRFGFLGLGIYGIFIYTLFKAVNDKIVKMMIIVYSLAGFYSNIYFSLQGIFYMTIILSRIRFVIWSENRS